MLIYSNSSADIQNNFLSFFFLYWKSQKNVLYEKFFPRKRNNWYRSMSFFWNCWRGLQTMKKKILPHKKMNLGRKKYYRKIIFTFYFHFAFFCDWLWLFLSFFIKRRDLSLNRIESLLFIQFLYFHFPAKKSSWRL